MTLREILGQEPAVSLLRRALAADRLPHALLFQGPEGVGKGATARALAATLLCERGGEDACSRCVPCLKVEHRNHPDLLIVERLPKKETGEGEAEEDEDSEKAGRGGLRKFIVISQIRDLSERAAYRPREGRLRVFILDPADRIKGEAQNALLRTLEEPPGRAIFILVASRPHLLIPTIRSRCTAIRFAPMTPSDLAARLVQRGMPEEEAGARAAMAEGRPGRALELDIESLKRRRDDVLQALESLAGNPNGIVEIPSLAAQLAGADEDALVDGLEILEGILREAARAAVGLPAALHPDHCERIEALGSRLGAGRLSHLIRGVERVRGDLRFNVNRTLIAEGVLAAVAGGPLP